MQKTILESMWYPYLKLAQRNFELMRMLSLSPEIKPPTPEESENPFLALHSQWGQWTQLPELLHMTRASAKNYIEFLLELGQSGVPVSNPVPQSFIRSQDALVQIGQSVVETLVTTPRKAEKSEKSDKKKVNTETQRELQEA